MSQKQLFVTAAVTDVSAYSTVRQDRGDLEGVGNTREVEGNSYRWIQNGSATKITAGMLVYGAAADGADLGKVGWLLSDLTYAQKPLLLGVAMASIDADSTGSAGDGGFGWVMRLGNCASVNMNASGTIAIAVGDLINGVTAGSYAVASGAAGGTAITNSTGGTGSATFGAIAATANYLQGDLTNIKNALAQIASELNALKAGPKGVIALQTLASSVTVTTAKRGFVMGL